MSKIVWLASYPKSGNTWLRAFLINYLANTPEPQTLSQLTRFSYNDMAAEPYAKSLGKDVSGLSWQDLLAHREAAHRYIIDSHVKCTGDESNSIPVKTHCTFKLPDGRIAITRSLTRSAIYVVRNPLDVVVSYAEHYGCGLKHSIDATSSTGHAVSGQVGLMVPQYVGPWGDHVSGWLGADSLPRMLIRYEDMIRDPHRAFNVVTQFLKFPEDEKRLNHAVECASFKNLKEQEVKDGFEEQSLHSKTFFRAGEFGGWRERLSNQQVKKIIRANGAMMQKMGYLQADGSPVF